MFDKKEYQISYYQKNRERLIKEVIQWREKNRGKVRNYNKKWAGRNKDKVREIAQIYKENNREQHRQYQREYRRRNKDNPKFRLDSNMAKAVWEALKNRKGGRKWQDLVGYTVKELKEHLELYFTPKMNWDNYGSYWEIDHFRPKSSFNYDLPTDLEFQECWGLDNLQPLEKSANRKKHNKLIAKIK